MSEIPFETIKQRAKCALDARIARCDPIHGATGFDGDRAGRMLIPYVLLDDEARAALRALARTLADAAGLGQRARARAQAGRTDWSQWLMHVRRTGHRLIDRWDVRCVAHLIAHLPECVTTRQRRATIACHQDDGTDEWIVVFAATARSSEEGL